ncbi:zinc transporter ZIP2-like [Macrobrachium nipponense]|uniref:zinc transporter ZIP2-like n=1 Tax=Macrobrachium nipponense TaxID=159736 RepID=UPI0030C8D37E
MLSLAGHKGVALTVMFVITLITSFSPLYLRKIFLKHVHGKKATISLSGCLCFGAGILMATIFLLILPEAVEQIEGAMEDGLIPTISYPITQMTLCLGFFFVYLIEEIVHYCIERKNKKGERGVSLQRPVQSVCDNIGFDHNGNWNDSSVPHMHDHSVTHHFLKKESLVGSLIVVLALSFHGLMEGMALGLKGHQSDVWLMFTAVCSHKIFISFSMSMELLEVGVPLKILILSMMIFALASPIGGLIGAIVIANSSGPDTAASILAPAFLQAISAGTILYVTFCEVLERERAKTSGGLVKFGCVLAGFAVMAALQTLDHDDDGDPTSTTTLVTQTATESVAAAVLST